MNDVQHNTAFRPFESLLDQQNALKILKAATDGADDGELFVERQRSEILSFDDGHLKRASYTASEGFGLRTVCAETSAYAHSSDISESALKRACDTTRLAIQSAVAPRTNVIPIAPAHPNTRLYSNHNPMADLAFSTKVETLQEIDDYARSLDPRVIQVSASLSASYQEVVILRPDGTLLTDERPLVRLNVSVIAEHEGRRESGSAGGGGRFMLAQIMERAYWQNATQEALRIALLNLQSVPAPAGVMDVVLGPGWPGVLLHEAVGHGLEGDFNRKKTSAFSELMGKKIAAEGVTVLDDGTLPNQRGSLTIDDEGTPSSKTTLIEDGILIGYMQDRQNARLMGTRPTGNGRRESYEHAPMPRMTNTYMLGGSDDPDAIIKDLKDGLYAVGFGGGQVDITNGNFVFNCTEAYRVKNGKILEPVRAATLIGAGAEALKHIHAIGNDMTLDPGLGSCGKAGQQVPVGVGQPTLKIGGLTVGGSAV